MNTAAEAETLTEQSVPETVELIAQLLTTYMGTKPGVWQIYNQRRPLPTTTGFFGDVACIGSKLFGVNRRPAVDPAIPDLISEQTANAQELIQIDIFSYDASARLRRLDVPFALNSQAAQNLAERWAFKIGRIPGSFVDTSEDEGSARLNKFSLSFAILRSYGRREAAPTFSVFQNPPQKLLVNP